MHSSLYCVFIMRENGIWNLAVKRTTHTLCRGFGILALLVLKTEMTQAGRQSSFCSGTFSQQKMKML